MTATVLTEKASHFSFRGCVIWNKTLHLSYRLLYVWIHHSTKTKHIESLLPRQLLHMIRKHPWDYIPFILYNGQM